MTEERLAIIAELSGYSIEICRDYIEYQDWPNMADHLVWIDTASDQEIADWIKACHK